MSHSDEMEDLDEQQSNPQLSFSHSDHTGLRQPSTSKSWCRGTHNRCGCFLLRLVLHPVFRGRIPGHRFQFPRGGTDRRRHGRKYLSANRLAVRRDSQVRPLAHSRRWNCKRQPRTLHQLAAAGQRDLANALKSVGRTRAWTNGEPRRQLRTEDERRLEWRRLPRLWRRTATDGRRQY